MAQGFCALTKAYGTFVESHLLPKALTRPSIEGAHFVETGYGKRPIKRWSSWFDNKLVCRSGEDILSALDDWAIKTLRQHQLVWSGLDTEQQELDGITLISEKGQGIREIELDTKQLRLFFLSLLWRAAATTRPEFEDVEISESDLEILRTMVVNGVAEPVSFFPITLTQLSTRGPSHNQPPLKDLIPMPAETVLHKIRTVPTFRFYFDGLITHFRVDPRDHNRASELGNLMLGNSNRVVLSTVPYEISSQRINLRFHIEDSAALWPTDMKKLSPIFF